MSADEFNEARLYLQCFNEYPGILEFDKCEHLVKFAVQCRTHSIQITAEHHISNMCHTMYFLRTQDIPWLIEHGRRAGKLEVQNQKQLKKAIEYLQKAAGILNVRDDLFYRQTTKAIYEKHKQSQHEADDTLRYAHEYPPRIEGETVAEFEARTEITNFLHNDYIDFGAHVHSQIEGRHDRTQGSVQAYCVRQLWEQYPQEMKLPTTDWQPYGCAAGIARLCGIDVDGTYVRKTVNI